MTLPNVPSGRFGVGGSAINAQDDPYSLIAAQQADRDRMAANLSPTGGGGMPIGNDTSAWRSQAASAPNQAGGSVLFMPIVNGKRDPSGMGGAYGRVVDKFGPQAAARLVMNVNGPAAAPLAPLSDTIGQQRDGVRVGHFIGPNAVVDYRQQHGLPIDGSQPAPPPTPPQDNKPNTPPPQQGGSMPGRRM